MHTRRIDPKRIQNLSEDPEIRRARDRLLELGARRELADLRAESTRKALAESTKSNADAQRALANLREEWAEISGELIQEHKILQRLLERKHHGYSSTRTPTVHGTREYYQFSPPLEACPIVQFPLTLRFMYVRTLDNDATPIWQEVQERVDPQTGVPTSIQVGAWGFGPFRGWVSAAWGFEAPNDPTLCGFEVFGHIALTRLVLNKLGSCVKVFLETGVTQYRTSKQLHEVNPSVDKYLTNVRSLCRGDNNTVYPDLFSDCIPS